MNTNVCVYIGDELANYHFGPTHPFGPFRYDAFKQKFYTSGLAKQVCLKSPVFASDNQILLFHTDDYLQQVKRQSVSGVGFLDHGDTPAFKGVYEAAAWIVGTVIDAVDGIMNAENKAAFVPIAGLHHAHRGRASGFCVFNDCGIAIEHLRKTYQLQSIAYIDIDAHHGDGVYYAFESDGDVIFADIHEDGKVLFPNTGMDWEVGKDGGTNRKLNISMPPHANDEQLFAQWEKVEEFLNGFKPDFIVLQVGADSLYDDPITHLAYSSAAHAHVTTRLCKLSEKWGNQRILALGGGGYNLENIAQAWNAVVEQLQANIT